MIKTIGRGWTKEYSAYGYIDMARTDQAVEDVARKMAKGVSFMVALLTVKDYYANISLTKLMNECLKRGLK